MAAEVTATADQMWNQIDNSHEKFLPATGNAKRD